MRIFSRLVPYLKNERGAAAVELALALPMLLALIAGLIEISIALEVQRKTSGVAQSVADLISQRTELDNARRDDLFAAGELLMAPWDSSSLGIGLASIRFDNDGAATIDWQESYRGVVVDQPLVRALPLSLPGQSVIIVEVHYDHRPLLADLFYSGISLEKRAFAKPRRTAFITRTGAE